MLLIIPIWRMMIWEMNILNKKNVYNLDMKFVVLEKELFEKSNKALMVCHWSSCNFFGGRLSSIKKTEVMVSFETDTLTSRTHSSMQLQLARKPNEYFVISMDCHLFQLLCQIIRSESGSLVQAIWKHKQIESTLKDRI